MITFIFLTFLLIIGIGALVVYSKNSGTGKASKPVQRSQEAEPNVGRAVGKGED